MHYPSNLLLILLIIQVKEGNITMILSYIFDSCFLIKFSYQLQPKSLRLYIFIFNIIDFYRLMALFERNQVSAHKVDNWVDDNDELNENIKKKRPKMTKLDIQKLFEESAQLTETHRRLIEQNNKLKKQFHKVEQSKQQRQQFISQVEKIVKEKSSELTSKYPHQSSWLVFKLHQKIFDLKQEIEAKDKSIRKLILSKQNQMLFRKEVELNCLKQINQYAELIGVLPSQDSQKQQVRFEQEEIVWMQEMLEGEKRKIQQFEIQLQKEQRQTKRLLTIIAEKKAEIKKMKQVQREYQIVQQNFLQQKKKKQQTTVDNKGYLTALLKERDVQTQKLEELRVKKQKMQEEENETIQKLSAKLQKLKDFYEQNKRKDTDIRHKTVVAPKEKNLQEWVKRVTLHEVQLIAKNLNYYLALRGVDQQKWVSIFFQDQKNVYSIKQVMEKLQAFPFLIAEPNNRRLLARYVVEDNNDGPMLENMETSQDSPIIKSILIKLIGPIKVYSNQQILEYSQQLGSKLSKYWSLVQQSIHIKEGVKNLITRQVLEQGIQNAEIQLTPQEIEYAVLFLFSWSHDISKLELNKLGKIKQLGIRFEQ